MTLIKLFLSLGVFICCCSSCQNATGVDYIFDNNFKGWAIIIFNAPNGKEEINDKGRIQIVIPSNGILFTKSKRPEGILNNQYFIKNAIGEKIKIYPSIESIPRTDTLTPYVLVESYQSFKFNETNYKENPINEKVYNFDEVIIFKITKGFKDTTANKNEIDKYITSIKQSLIKAATQ